LWPLIMENDTCNAKNSEIFAQLKFYIQTAFFSAGRYEFIMMGHQLTNCMWLIEQSLLTMMHKWMLLKIHPEDDSASLKESSTHFYSGS